MGIVENYVVRERYLAFIDVIKGYFIRFTNKQILFENQVPVKLSNEELTIYKHVLEAKTVNVDEVAGRFGISVTRQGKSSKDSYPKTS